MREQQVVLTAKDEKAVENKTIQIGVNVKINSKQSLYKAWVYCLNPFFGLKRREMELFEKFITLYISNINNKAIDKLLFSTKVKKAIRSSMVPSMSEASLNNHIMQLRKKRVLVDERFSDFIISNLPIKDSVNICYKIATLGT